ncbi:MAG: EpsG family protein [Muribaculaceae bacterium]|nr:EpsG family protein [Muribaculaceae bacterium]
MELFLLSMLKIKDRRTLTGILVFNLILFVILIGFKDITKVKDTYAYLISLTGMGEDSNEPTFKLIVSIVNFISPNDYVLLFFIYGLISCWIKGWAIFKQSNFIILSLLIWFADLFPLQELTQIRAGVANGLLLLSIPSLYRKDLRTYAFICLVASLFHYSALMMVPLWFLNGKKFNFKLWAGLVTFFMIIAILGFDAMWVISLIPIPAIQAKYSAYLILQAASETNTNIFSVMLIVKLCLTIFLAYNIRKIYLHNRFAILYTKIMLLSIILLFAFSTNLTFALRSQELLGIVDILLFPLLLYIIKPQYLARMTLLVIATGFMYIRVIYGELIKP